MATSCDVGSKVVKNTYGSEGLAYFVTSSLVKSIYRGGQVCEVVAFVRSCSRSHGFEVGMGEVERVGEECYHGFPAGDDEYAIGEGVA